MKLAAVTMVYNEPEYLPVWLRHYGGAVGLEHCHVIDHGSTDGSTEAIGLANRLRLPRSPHDDARRAGFVSTYCASLLSWYDAVIHTDVDELLVVPGTGLTAYAAAAPADVISAIGLNLLHLADEEPALDFTRPVLPQRRWAWFASAMCKPALIRRPVSWGPGFHSADTPVAFDRLFLIHLRYADRATALARLARTRAMPWANLAVGAHQRVSDEAFIDMCGRLERMDRTLPRLDPKQPPLSAWLRRVVESQAGRQGQAFGIALDIENYELWRLDDGWMDREPSGRPP